MADAQANINLNLNTSGALAQLRALQRQISLFQQQMARGNANTVAQAQGMQRNLLNTINATGQFSARMTTVSTATESFTNALEKNKLSMGQYFSFAGGASKNFGRFFKNEMNMVGKVARERVKDIQTQYIKMGRDANGAMRAMAVRPLSLDMDNLATRTAVAAQKQQIFNQLIRQGSTNLLNWGKNTQWAGRQLMVGFTIPLTIFGATAMTEFRKLEEQAVRFRRVYGDMFTTSAETEQALDDIRSLAEEFTKYGIAVEKTIGLGAKVAQMGNMGKDLEQQVIQATRLAVLGGLEQEEALDTTISLTNAFGVAAEDLADKIGFLNAAENQTILAIEDFNEAIPKAGSVVQQLGGDVEDLAFFLTAMREGGVNASQGANALKSSLGRLVNPTERAKQRLGALGIDIVSIVEGNVGDLRGTIMELGYELDALAPLERSRAIEQLFGKFQFARMSTMFQNIIKDGSQAQKVLELTTNSSEELAILAERELARVEESPAFRLQKSFEQLQASLAPLGEQFAKVVTPIIDFGTNLLKRFEDMGEGGKRFVTILVTALGAVAPVALMTIGLIANGVANLAKFMQIMLSVGKSGSASMQQLGSQTQYMTQEQIEANAIAASLNNSHERLRQTFTSEAAAVNSLTAAYQRATAAQASFAFGPGRAGRGGAPVRGYADGVVSVPGPKGAGDIIPAMLSPGEAVIPAKMAQKYSPIIDQMIRGDIPGFFKGVNLSNLGLYSAPSVIKSQTSAMPSYSTEAAENEFLEKLAKERSLSQSQLRNLMSRQASHISPDTKQFSAGGRQFNIKNWFAKNLMMDKGAINNFSNNLVQSTDILDDFVKNDIGQVSKKLGMSVKETQKTVDKFKKGMAPANAKEAKVMQEVASADARRSQARLDSGEKMSRTERRRLLNRRYQAEAAAGTLRIRSKGDFYETMGERAYDPRKDKQAQSQQNKRVQNIKNAINAEKSSTKATKKSTAAKEKDTRATQQNTDAKKRSTRQQYRDPATGRFTSRPRDLSNVSRLTSTSPVLSSPMGLASTSQTPAQPGRFRRVMNMGRGSGGMGIAMGASALAMGGSMLPGQIGQTMQKLMPAIMGISLLAPMIGMLGAPLTALIAVVGGLTAAYFLHKKAIEDTAKETYELQRSLGSSRTAIQSLAEGAGRVTDREIFERQQQNRLDPFQIAAGKTTFGENFVEGDPGQALVSNVRTSLTNLGRDQTVTSVFQQLGQAVGEGALSIPEARSIATELGDQIDDMSFGMEVNANLMRLLGPGGEDLTAGDRLTILADLREDRQRTRAEMDLDYEETSYADIFDAESEANERLGEIIEESGSMLGAMATSGEAWKIWWGAVTGTTAAQDNIKQMSTILAQGVNDADAYASEMAAIEVAYGEDLEKAYAMEDQYEISRLERERSNAQRELVAQRKQDQDQILSQLGEDTSKARIAMKQALEVDFADDEAALAQYQGALKQIQDLDLSDQKSLQLEYMLTSGDMEFSTAMAIVENYEELPQVSEKILEIQTKFGGDFGKNASDLFSIFNDLDEGLAEEFVLNLDTSDLDEYQRQIEGFGAVSRITNLFPEGEEILLDLALKDETVLDRIVERTNKIEALDNEQITLDFIANTFGDEALAAAEAIWSTIPTEDRKDALYSILTALDLQMGEGFDELFESLKGETIAGVTVNEPGDILSLIGARTSGIAQGNRQSGDSEEVGGTGGSGGGPDTSWLDDIVKQFRDFRQVQQELTQGWDASLDAIMNFAQQGVAGFQGLSNQMRSVGASESLIEKVLGMSPEEWAQRKDELFNFDVAGNIAGLTAAGQAIQDALNTVTIGKFVAEQENITVSVSNQIVALDKLTAAGASYEAAYRAVQNTALAAAIATARSSAEIQAAAEAAMKAQEMMDKFEEINEEEQRRNRIRDAVREMNKEFSDQARILDYIDRNRGNLEDAQISALLNNKDLRSLALEPNIDPGSLKTALENARRQADLELRVQVSTEEGRLGLFDEMMNEVMGYFGREENKINIDFEISTDADQKLIRDIENQISGMQFEIDDYEAQLRGIEDAESAINERYEKRFEALDKVADANERINRTQQTQLDLADALSRGDIAAAARAQQDLAAVQAEDAQEIRRASLERQQASEIAAVRSDAGLSRTDIEEKIKELQDEIFKLEENQLEPAQERIRIAEYNRDLQIDALEVSGKTRTEWEQISNLTARAAQDTEEFAKNVERALALYEFFVNDVPLPLDLFGGEFDAKLEKMGVEVKKEKERSQIFAASTAIGQSIDEAIEEGKELTPAQEKALELAGLNDTFVRVKTLRKEANEIESGMEISGKAASDQSTFFQDIFGNTVFDTRALEATSGVLITRNVGGSGSPAQTAQEDKRIADLRKEANKLIQDNRDKSKEFAQKLFGGSDGQIYATADAIERAYQSTLKAAREAAKTIPRTPTSGDRDPRPRRDSDDKPSSRERRIADAIRASDAKDAARSSTQTRNVPRKVTIPKGATIPSWYSGGGMIVPKRMAVGGFVGGFNAPPLQMNMGGQVKGYPMGGLIPYKNNGGFFKSLGSDTVPAMLTPGEFVIRRPAVRGFGVDKLEEINRGTYNDGSVYNYNLAVNVKSDADPDRIARTVISTIKQVDRQRIRGNKV